MADHTRLEVRKVAEADFPTEYGHFRIYGFEARKNGVAAEAVALVMGDVLAPAAPLVRIHSQCLTGDVFHSLRCDCRAQLELSLEMIAAEGRGIVVYENEEGRGIGLLNKLRAYALQDAGADTVEANQQLGFEVDLRQYEAPAEVLRCLGVKSVRLLTNNPEKIAALEACGVRVAARIPCQAESRGGQSEDYLRTKKERMGHILDL
jgi:GTP cyclohydrolase II